MSDEREIEYEFYELVRRTVYKAQPGEFRIASAAYHSCSTCGDVIATNGGPGDGDICIRCGDIIRRQKAVGCIIWEDNDP